jgi:predicted O-methyltransferase YrrM
VRSTRLDRPSLTRRLREQLGLIRLAGLVFRWRFFPPWEGYGRPFNGQRSRQQVIHELIALFKPNLIIETGTFLGDTTRHLADYDVPVVTAELDPRYFRMARLRLGRRRDVELICGDSVGALNLTAHRDDQAKPVVYLDAHWYERNPLTEELGIVFKSWSDAVIVIDDFLVPNEPGYAYDEWQGRALSEANLELPSDAMLAYPAEPPERETGARRGAAFIGRGPAATASLKGLISKGLLREARTTASQH